jgi:hypothetical protein
MQGLARVQQAAVAGLAVALAGALFAQSAQPPASAEPPWQAFVAAAGTDERAAREALTAIGARWRDQYAAMIIDLARLLPSPRGPRQIEPIGPDAVDGDGERSTLSGPSDLRHGPPPAGARVRQRLTSFLERQTGQRFGDNLRAWRRWIWELPDRPHGDYPGFKAEVYARVDSKFRAFFPPGVKHAVRLDEIDWGGVRVNGIPPLRSPQAVPAADARWLRDGHVVFGLEVNGEARAYPKRILAWHEMAIDRLGGLDLTIVYCTLCGTVIPYESQVDGRRFTFGTSGLLYRSNKLMFDEETRSLWSSLEGVPVVGPLVGAGIQLRFQSAVTTTWGEWRRQHPATTVLSLDTGFTRDYSEGAAYRQYFATDNLMFDVPATDRRLRNKAEVLVLRPELLEPDSPPVAIAVDLLKRTPVFLFDAGARRFVVVTSKAGASRIYERGSVGLEARDPDGRLRDSGGNRWRVTPDALVGENGQRLPRVPSHQVFWFAWYAQHPDTVLHR